ncbi:MAG: hypothetical protein IJW40_08355 [Clostridia bacterium]|nr:hypothetical protein [Clostridia bacterium]
MIADNGARRAPLRCHRGDVHGTNSEGKRAPAHTIPLAALAGLSDDVTSVVG